MSDQQIAATLKAMSDALQKLSMSLESEKAKQKEQERKDDTRRKILAGSCVLKLANEDPEAHVRLMRQLDKYLIESRDRQLFNL